MHVMKKGLSTVLALLVLLMAFPFGYMTAYAGDSAHFVLGEYADNVITIANGGENGTLLFIPEETALYRYYSTSGSDVVGSIQDSNGDQIAYCDDAEGYGNNFCIEIQLSAGATYYFNAWYYSEHRTGDIPVYLVQREGVDVSSLPVLELNKTTTAIIEEDVARFAFTPEKTAYYAFYSMAEDRDTYGTLYDVYENELSSNDDGGEHLNFRVSYELTAGVTYIFEACYLGGDTGSFPVCIEEATPTVIQSITFHDLSYLESDRDEGGYLYIRPNMTVYYSDGSISNESGSWLRDELGSYYVSYMPDVETELWEVNNTYTVTVYVEGLGIEGSFQVEFAESPIASVQTVPMQLIENYHGEMVSDEYYDEDLDQWVATPEYFRYNIDYTRGLIITLKDGTVTRGDCFEWNDRYYYLNYEDTQSYENAWTVGVHTVQASLAGYDFTYEVEIVENPIASVVAEPVIQYEHSNGSWRYDYYYDEVNDTQVEVEYFYYWDVAPDCLTITLKDGTVYRGVSSFEWNDVRYDVETQEQNYQNQLLSGVNVCTGTLLGYTFDYVVEIVAPKSNDLYEYVQTGDGIIIQELLIPTADVEIPAEIDGIPVIGVAALGNHSEIINLILPDSVITVGNSIFSNLPRLQSVILGAGVSNLTAEMFRVSYDLQSIAVSNSNPYFCVQDGVLYNKAMDTFIAYPVSCGSSDYEVPATVVNLEGLELYIYEYLNVTYAEGHLLYVTIDGVTYNREMTKIIACESGKAGVYVMPETVVEIAEGAFAGTDLTEVVIAPGVTEIVYRVFAGCMDLESVVFPEGLISIGYASFAGTSSLESVDLPDSLEEIGSGAFSNSGLKTLSVPDSVRVIGSSAFYRTDIVTLDLGNGVAEIGYYAFAETPVTAVVLPDCLTWLGGGAFSDCTQLTELTIGSGLTEIEGSAFAFTGILQLNIPANIYRINSSAFHGAAVEQILLSEGVTVIDDYAFAQCDVLTSVHLPASLQYLSSVAFTNCDALVELTVTEGNPIYYGAGNCVITYGGTLVLGCGGSVIPNDGSVTQIGECAFYDCDSLLAITLPDSLREINGMAFEDCNGLTEIAFPDGLLIIGYGAFRDCDSIRSIVIPDSVTELNEESFSYMDQLTDVTLGDGIEYVGPSAFAFSAVSNVNLGNSVTYISPAAFESTNLRDVFFPASVTEIAYGAFMDCQSLTSVEIPLSLQTIEFNAFNECTSLTDVYYQGTEEDRANMNIDEEGNEYLLNATWHYGWINQKWLMADCEHVYDNACDTNCNICAYLREVGDHVYDDLYDPDCNECGSEREVPDKLTFTVDNASARPGETVNVTVRVDNNPGIIAFHLFVEYDTDVLELVGANGQDFAGMSYGPLDKVPFSMLWADGLHPDNTTNGVVTTLTFYVKEGAALGDTVISLTCNPDEILNFAEEIVPAQLTEGVVRVAESVPGDADGDGRLHITDAVLLMQYMNGWDVEANVSALDVNRDGKINNLDYVLIVRYLNGWDVTLY